VDVKVHTHILGVTARTTLQQTFVNTGTTDIPELKYVLPLHDDVCVVSFTAAIGARKIDGVVLERVTAQQQYDAQGLAGVDLPSLPSLDGVFAMRLGPPRARGTGSCYDCAGLRTGAWWAGGRNDFADPHERRAVVRRPVLGYHA